MIKERNYQIDNIKAIMIFFVVLGHLLEFNITDKTNYLLLVIYSFHMPVFVYFSGCLAKYNPKKMLKNILLPYVFIQTIAYIFYSFFRPTDFYLVSAYQSLWYMLSLFSWYLLIPIFDSFKHPKLIILISLLLGLLIGYDNSSGFVCSIFRTITFLPFFLFGYYYNKEKIKVNEYKFSKLFSMVLVIIICLILFIFRNNINVQWMYGSHNYHNLGYNSTIRFALYAIAIIWIYFFKCFITNKKTIVSKIGKNSISIYLLHFFLVYMLAESKLLYIGNHSTINCFIYAILITFILSSNSLTKIFKRK